MVGGILSNQIEIRETSPKDVWISLGTRIIDNNCKKLKSREMKDDWGLC